MNAHCSRADLVRLLQQGGTGLLGRGIGLLGFESRPLAPPAPRFVPAITEVEAALRPKPEPPKPPAALQASSAGYLRVVSARHLKREDLTSVKVTELPGRESGKETEPQSHPPDPLVPWPRLWRRLRTHLCQPYVTREVDVPALTARLARGQSLRHVPRLRRARLASQPRIILDRALDQMPFWSDQDQVAHSLTRWIAHASGDAFPVLPGDSPLARLAEGYPDLPAPDVRGRMVVLLGDLGSYGGSNARRAWHQAGQWLLRQGACLRALVPAPWWRVDQGLAELWNAMPWDEREGRSIAMDPCARRRRADRVLTLLSPALRIEPGLLRRARRRFYPGASDSGTEVDVLHHPAVIGYSAEALSLDPKWKGRLETEFDQLDPGTQRDLHELLTEWHKGLRPEILAEEGFQLLLRLLDFFSETEKQELCAFMLKAAQAIDTQDAAGALVPDVAAWARESLARMDPSAWENPQLPANLRAALRKAWAVANRGNRKLALPPGFTAEDLQILNRWRPNVPTRWQLWQVGEALVVRPAMVSSTGGDPEPRPRAGKLRPGSPLAEIVAAEPQVLVRRPGVGTTEYPLSIETSEIPLPEGTSSVLLATDCQTVQLAALPKPAWAKRIGRDAFGLWADIEYKGVAQRMRWIAPGKFLLGSPDDEPERLAEREAQHEVELTQGYWLADTACTQELWVAVMGKNPSGFWKPGEASRPVENVSWDDSQGFLRKLGDELGDEAGSGEVLRLPTEAEWEYACRAGATTPFSFGASITPDSVNYDGNHPYAGGLKGKYRQETVPVKSLPANPWGLHEMHGNVWEWCEDRFEAYSRAPAQDPLGANPSVSNRVVRGGSWFNSAWYARSAYRNRYQPGGRLYDLGFRFSRGRPVWQEKRGAE